MTPQCFMTDDGQILAHVLIPTKYRHKQPVAGKTDSEAHVLWQFQCEAAGECVGAQLKLTPGKPVGAFDFGPLRNVRVLSRLQNQAIIQWGSWQTFTFDFLAQTVSFRVSDPYLEGSGFASCKTPPQK